MPPRCKKRVAEPPEAASPSLVRQRLAQSTCSQPLCLALSNASKTARTVSRFGRQSARVCTNSTDSLIATACTQCTATRTRMAYAHPMNHHKPGHTGGPAPRRLYLQQPQFQPCTTHDAHLQCHTYYPRPHNTTHARSTRWPHTSRSNTTRLLLPRALWLPAAHTLYERRQLDLCLGRAAPVTPHHGATGSGFHWLVVAW